MVISWIHWILKMLIFMMRHVPLFSRRVLEHLRPDEHTILSWFFGWGGEASSSRYDLKAWPAINSLAMVHEIHEIHFNPDRKPKEDLSRSE